jgi:cell division protein FtsL
MEKNLLILIMMLAIGNIFNSCAVIETRQEVQSLKRQVQIMEKIILRD